MATENDTSEILYRDVTFGINVSMLIVCWLGFYGNTLSLLIFKKQSMSSSINVLLIGLSCIDTFLLFTSLPVYTIPNLLDYYDIDNKYYNAVFMLLLYPLSMVAQTCSVWTFVVISVERYIAVCRPFMANKYVTIGRAKFAQVSVVVVAVLYNLIRFWEYGLKMDIEQAKLEGYHWEYYEPLLRFNPVYFSVYYSTLYFFTHVAFPFLAIIILNGFIVRTLKAQDTRRLALTSVRLWHHNTSTMVVVVTVVFVLFNTPTFVVNLWEWSSPNLFDESSGWKHIGYLLIDMTNIFVMLNSSVNFVVYYIYCAHYRYYFWNYNRKLFCHKKLTSTDVTHACKRVSLITQLSRTSVKTSVVEMNGIQIHLRQTTPVRRMAFSDAVAI